MLLFENLARFTMLTPITASECYVKKLRIIFTSPKSAPYSRTEVITEYLSNTKSSDKSYLIDHGKQS